MLLGRVAGAAIQLETGSLVCIQSFYYSVYALQAERQKEGQEPE
jgi:hypothetical protein